MYAARLKRCRALMKKHRVSAFLVSYPNDYYYLTGFTGEDSAILVTPREIHVLTDGRFEESSRHEVPWAKKWLRKGSLVVEIGRVALALKLKAMAIQSNHLTVGDHAEIRKQTKLRRLLEPPAIVAEMRKLKDAHELAALQKAIRVAEQAFLATKASIRLGQTELDIAARLEYEMKKRGASAPSFPTMVAEGVNAALPHAKAGTRRVRRGSALLFDWGARVDGYCSDLTRVLFVGTMSPKFERIYGLVWEAQTRALAGIRPGARMCDVDAIARDCIKDRGYGEAFNHSLGHGLGLDVHEPPALSWRSKEKLAAGMLVTVEPGVYLPGFGGVRIEDVVLVTATGGRVLSRLSKQPADAVIPARG